ncbi:MAG: type I 3-dehydroquinate dehydratase [Nitrospirae bacterium]|nr:type I 3-dehydroquinate dehydratase [Nitrospirota bacterium]
MLSGKQPFNIFTRGGRSGYKPLIAVPLTDSDVEAVQSLEGAHIAELRLDMFSSLNRLLDSYYVDHIISTCKEKFGLPVLATCRAKEEGGSHYVPDSSRKDILISASHKADAIDVEINSAIAPLVVSALRASTAKTVTDTSAAVTDTAAVVTDTAATIVLSYHDFEKTPQMSTLIEVYEKGKSLGADIIKIAAMARTMDDLRVLTRFILDHSGSGINDIVVIAMGEMAMSSRLFFPLIGSLFTFASLNTRTAPGQLSLEDVTKFF